MLALPEHIVLIADIIPSGIDFRWEVYYYRWPGDPDSDRIIIARSGRDFISRDECQKDLDRFCADEGIDPVPF